MARARHEHEARVLLLAPAGRDGPLGVRVLHQAGLCAESCADAEELCRELAAGCGALLLTQEALDRASLAKLTACLGGQPAWSDVPIVVILGEGELARALAPPQEVLRNATYLERPVRIVTLVSTLRAALAARRRQYEVRDHIAEHERIAADLGRAYDHLKEQDRRKDQFLALLGHELRNPLAAISNGVLLLRAAQGRPERVAQVTGIIERQTRNLCCLVDDLLDVARVTAGKIALRRQPLELNELAARCEQTVAAAAEAQGHAVTRVPAPGPLWVEGDPVRLEQVVVNLLMNAVKYTPPGGRIELLLAQEEGRAALRVRDDGVGIAPAMLPHVFEPFSQAPQTLDRAQGGLGIGLTLVHSLVVLHGGTVTAASDGVGRGSEFVVRLPLRPAPAAPRPASGKPPTGPAPHRRIVLIEDNADHSETMQELLRSMGHEVEAVGDGLVGVERVLAGPPDVALVDIGLPGIDGYEVARRIRAGLSRDVLLVAMTGYGQPEDRRRSQEAGFDAHLTKPLALDALAQVLALPPAQDGEGAGPDLRSRPSAAR